MKINQQKDFYLLSFKHSFVNFLASQHKIEQIKFSFCEGNRTEVISFLFNFSGKTHWKVPVQY